MGKSNYSRGGPERHSQYPVTGSQQPGTPVPEDSVLSPRPLWAPGTRAVHIHMCGQNIHTHTIKQIHFEK